MFNKTIEDALQDWCFPEDLEITIYVDGDKIYDGYAGDCPSEFLELTFICWDNPNWALDESITICAEF